MSNTTEMLPCKVRSDAYGREMPHEGGRICVACRRPLVGWHSAAFTFMEITGTLGPIERLTHWLARKLDRWSRR